jgi:hypothetical protein
MKRTSNYSLLSSPSHLCIESIRARVFFLLLLLFFGAEDWTQGLMLAKQTVLQPLVLLLNIVSDKYSLSKKPRDQIPFCAFIHLMKKKKIFFFFSAGDEIQGLKHARQALYH